jgi:acyl carrier protein
MDRITEAVIDYAKLYTSEDVTLQSNLIEDLWFDEMDILDWTMDLEEEFDISISDEQMDELNTIGDAVRLVAELTKQEQYTAVAEIVRDGLRSGETAIAAEG